MPDTPAILIASPDRRVALRVTLGDWSADGVKTSGALRWQVSFDDRVMLRESRISALFGDQPPLAAGLELIRSVRQRRRRSWEPDGGDAAQVSDDYNGLVLRLREQAQPARCCELIFRCYDTGVAVRAHLPRQRGTGRLPLVGGTLCFPAGTLAWLEQDGAFQPRPLEALDMPCAQPCTFNYVHGRLACVVSQDAGAWQVLLLAERPVDLPARRGLLLNLGFVHEPAAATPAADDAVWNCLAPFGMPAADRRLQNACPTTPAHRLAAALVRGEAVMRWDETRFLRGEIGAYLVVARRLGGVWQVGGITAAEGRILTVRLEDFLAPQRKTTYALELVRDPLPSEPADTDGVVRETFAGVEATDAPRLELPPGGGFLLRLTPEAC